MKIAVLLAFALSAFAFTGHLLAQEQDVRKYTNVSVQLQAAPPADIFKAIGNAGHVEFIPPANWGRGEQIRLTFNMQNQPFWITALQAGGIFGYTFDTVSLNPADRRVRIQLSKPLPGRQMLLAPPLVVMLEISKTQSSSIDLVTFADPALKDWVFSAPPEITEVTDAAGESLLPEKPKPQIAAPAGLISRHPVQIKKITREISSLKGSFVLLTADTVDEWLVANPAVAVAQERKIGNATYSFKSLRKSGRQYELTLHVKAPADGGFKAGAYELTVGQGSILASDAAGQPWRISAIKGDYKAKQMTAIGDYEYVLTLIPEKGTSAGDIASIKWRIPTKMSNVEVPFEFGKVSFTAAAPIAPEN